MLSAIITFGVLGIVSETIIRVVKMVRKPPRNMCSCTHGRGFHALGACAATDKVKVVASTKYPESPSISTDTYRYEDRPCGCGMYDGK